MGKNRRIVNNIRNDRIAVDELHFQYFPGRFIRDLYGSDGNMMLVKNSPHYSFLQKYDEIGDDVLKFHTDYYKMHNAWGRDDRFIHAKTSKFINLYKLIKKDKFNKRIMVVENPLYERVFDSGYEIYDGHHRASIYAFLGQKEIDCQVVNVKIIKNK
jgi:hypothetical protein